MEPSKRDYAKEVYAELAAWKKKRRRISHHPAPIPSARQQYRALMRSYINERE
jgi:hypothetical protein